MRSLGTRDALNFDLSVHLREGGHHSGNWGGLLANPGIILAHALASITSATGEILVPELLAPIARDGLRIMAGMFWDLGEPETTRPAT